MIPATRAHSAIYRTKHGHFTYRPVIAWDDDGHPLVLGMRCLIAAYDAASEGEIFSGVTDSQEAVVAAVPGGGWLIDCTGEDGDTWTEPIVTWTVRADGSVTPITTDAHGVTDVATSGLAKYRIYHPDGPTWQLAELEKAPEESA